MLTALCLATTLLRKDDFRAWGFQEAEIIRQRYKMPQGALYADALNAGKPDRPAFTWGVGVWMSALNSAARLDPRWKPELKAYVEETRSYWNRQGPVPGYDTQPNVTGIDRYYDDNEWMVMSLCDAADVLRDKRVLGWAEDTLKYVLSGEDDKLGGGVYWHEPRKDSKNACSNGPAAAACLAVYDRTKNAAYLDQAKTLYAWTKTHLQDPADNLFWDNVKLDGTIQRTKWSYNTALMIRSAAELGRITGERAYKDDAETMATASEKRWIDPATGAMADGGRFAHLLLDSWTFAPSPRRKAEARRALAWLHANGPNAEGFYGAQFNAPPRAGARKFELIDQASAARAYLMAP